MGGVLQLPPPHSSFWHFRSLTINLVYLEHTKFLYGTNLSKYSELLKIFSKIMKTQCSTRDFPQDYFVIQHKYDAETFL